MHSDTVVTIRCRGLQAGARSALVALACIGLAGCGGGPGGRQPDLVVESPSVSADTPAAGASLTFSATVRNAGDRSAAATTLRVYRSDDDTITTDDEQLGADTVEALAASATGGASVELTAPSSPGTHHYGACVDAVAGESDTANNCSEAAQVTVPEAPAAPLPDLVVESAAVSAGTPAAGARFTFSATVRNAGGGTAAATTLLVYLSADETITTADREVDATTVAELAASASEVAEVELTAPPGAGTYYYGGCVEPVAEEFATANNCSASVSVTVRAPQVGAGPPRPDLIVVAPGVSNANPATGGVLELEAEARNRGGAPSPVTTTLRFYLSSDATITRSDTEVGTRWVHELGIDCNRSYRRGYLTVNTPSTKGEYYYGACVDAVPGESDTTNNCSAAVKIKVSHNKPDLGVGSWSLAGFPRAGKSFGMATQVHNTGGPSPATTLRLLLLPDRTSAPSAGTEAGSGAVPALVVTGARRASTLVSVLAQAPATSGTYYYVACVDAVLGESDTTNNCSLSSRVKVID